MIFRGITISPVLFKIFEHCLMNGFQTFFTSGDVGSHTESLQVRDDNSSSSSSEDEDRRPRQQWQLQRRNWQWQRLHQPLTTAAKCAWYHHVLASHWCRADMRSSVNLDVRVIHVCGMPRLSCGYYHGNAHFFWYDRLCQSTLATFSLNIAILCCIDTLFHKKT